MNRKIYLTVLFLLCCCLTPSFAAESTTYQPYWKVGDSIVYNNTLNFALESPEFPAQLQNMPNGLLEISFQSKYKILSQNDDKTEFQLSLDQIELKPYLLEKARPNWRDQLSEKDKKNFELLNSLQNKPLLSFQVNSEGKIVQYTRLNETAEIYHSIFTFLKENDPNFAKTTGSQGPQSVDEWITWLDKQLNNSGFAPLPQETVFWLYSSLHTGKAYPLNQQTAAKFTLPIPKISELFENPEQAFNLALPQESLHFDLKGISFAKKQGTSSTIETIYPIKENDFYQFSSTLLEAFMPKKEEKDKKEASDFFGKMKQKKAFLLNGTIVERFTFEENTPFQEGTLLLSLDGKIYPNRMRETLPTSADINQEIPFKLKVSYTSKKMTQ